MSNPSHMSASPKYLPAIQRDIKDGTNPLPAAADTTVTAASTTGRWSFSAGNPLKKPVSDQSRENDSRMTETVIAERQTTVDGDGGGGGCEKTSVDEVRKMIVTSERLKQVEDVIKTVVSAHINTTNYTTATVSIGYRLYETISRGHDDETCEMSEMLKIVGTPKPDQVWTSFVENMSSTIKRIVAFVKLLPGFADLCKEDKINLFKHGSFEVILLRYCRLFTDSGMFVPDMTVRVPRPLIPMMPLGDFFEEQYKFADVFNQLDLNDAETGIVTAIVVMNDSRPGLKNRDQVQKLRKLFLQCLYVSLKRNRPEDHDSLFTDILETLPLSAKVNEMHATIVGNMKKNNPEVHFPDVHNEIFQ